MLDYIKFIGFTLEYVGIHTPPQMATRSGGPIATRATVSSMRCPLRCNELLNCTVYQVRGGSSKGRVLLYSKCIYRLEGFGYRCFPPL